MPVRASFCAALLLVSSLSAPGDVVVALVCAGVDRSHPDLAKSLVEGRSFVEGGDAGRDPANHGTPLALLVAGRATAAREAGAAAGLPVKVWPLQVATPERPEVSPETLARALEAVLEKQVDVVCLPLASARRAKRLDELLSKLAAAGAAVFAPSGASPDGFDLYPASHPDVFSVAPTDDGELSAFANASAATDVLAPALSWKGGPRGGGVAAARAAAIAAAVIATRPEVPRLDRLRMLRAVGDGRVLEKCGTTPPPRLWDAAALKAALARPPLREGRWAIESVEPVGKRALLVRLHGQGAASGEGRVRVFSKRGGQSDEAAIEIASGSSIGEARIAFEDGPALLQRLEVMSDKEAAPSDPETFCSATQFSDWTPDCLLPEGNDPWAAPASRSSSPSPPSPPESSPR